MEAGDKAEKYCRQAMEGRGRTLGKEDAQTLKSTDMLARALWLSGRRGNESQLAEAALLQRGTLVLTEQKRGKEDLETLRYAQFLGTVLLESGKLEEAEEVLAATLERREKVLGSDDVNTLWSVYRLGMVFQGQKRFEKAEELYRRVLDWDARCSGEPDLLEMTEDALNLLYRDNGRDSDAERVLSCRAEARRSERAEAS
jgi:tetratricopeptide (TPR) repeat protein